jgi:hypothetical protein
MKAGDLVRIKADNVHTWRQEQGRPYGELAFVTLAPQPKHQDRIFLVHVIFPSEGNKKYKFLSDCLELVSESR